MDFRFDDAYENVYVEKDGSFVFACCYFSVGINAKMSDKEKTQICENDEDLLASFYYD